MKKLKILLILLAFFNVSIYSQTKGIRYKAIVNDSGIILKNKPVSIKFTFLENGETEVYTETHETLTSKNGLVNLTIGEGYTSDEFNDVDWSESQFLKVEIDYGSGYVHVSTTDYKEVPYALYANTAKKLENPTWNKVDGVVNTNDAVGIGVKEVDKNAILEISSTDKGLLIPRLEIKDLNKPDPLKEHKEGMLVYNTNKGQEGLYYNNGQRWVKSNDDLTKDGKTCVNPIKVANNINAMKALSIPSNSCINYIEVLGYYTPGDGGSGSFYFDPNSSASVNDGTVFKRDSIDTGRFIRVFSGPLNVRWFGARPDVYTDQGPYFRKAIVATRIWSSGKIIGSSHAVFIPTGVYTINSPLFMHSGLRIFGENMYNTVLKNRQGGNGAIIENWSNQQSNGGRTSLSNFTISTNSKFGIRYETWNTYPFTAKFDHLEVYSYANQGFAISIEGLSHAEFNSISCSAMNDGVAFKVSAKQKNTGVFAFSNCKFGSSTSDGNGDRIGFWFANGDALDSFVFDSCFFSAQKFCEYIGYGNNYPRGITHNACHYEMNHNSNKYDFTNIISFDGNDGGGAISCSWTDCTFSGRSSKLHWAINFDPGNYANIRFINNHFILNNKYAFMLHDGSKYRNCVIDGAYDVNYKLFTFESIGHRKHWTYHVDNSFK